MAIERALIDTNALIALSKREKDVAELIDTIKHPVLPMMVVGELIYGALNSSRPEANLAALAAQLAEFEILNIDRHTANFYGWSCMALRKKGRPIPDNDFWIAALGLQHSLPVVTRDKHFLEVRELVVLGW